MSLTILAAKLYIPPPRHKIIFRLRLIEKLNEGLSLGHRLTVIFASAGFGKTTLASEWIATCGKPVAWLSLDETVGEHSQAFCRSLSHTNGQGFIEAID